MFSTKRLGKELQKLHGTLPPGISLVSAPDFKEWQMDIQVLDSNPIYANETFRLRFRFTDKYPIEVPEVTFVRCSAPVRNIPLHPHIYSNGIICLDLLGTGWTPVQNVESISMSLQSMLASNSKAERPEGDEEVCRRTGMLDGESGSGSGSGRRMRVRDMGFVYDDDKV